MGAKVLKYVMTKHGPIIFPPMIDHHEIYDRTKVTSAGFLSVENVEKVKVQADGFSTKLGINSKAGDGERIEMLLKYGVSPALTSSSDAVASGDPAGARESEHMEGITPEAQG